MTESHEIKTEKGGGGTGEMDNEIETLYRKIMYLISVHKKNIKNIKYYTKYML